VQSVGAICGVVGYYGVALPVGVSLMFDAKLGIKGEEEEEEEEEEGGTYAAFHLYSEVGTISQPPTSKSKMAAPLCINSSDSCSNILFFSTSVYLCLIKSVVHTILSNFYLWTSVATVFVRAKCSVVRCYQLVLITMANLARANPSTAKISWRRPSGYSRLVITGTRATRV